MRKSLYVEDNARFVPTVMGRGFWSEDSLNGAAVAGLLGHCLERDFAQPDYVATRFCVDLLGLLRAVPLTVETRLLRAGGRLQLAEATIAVDGRLMARATCQFIRRSEPAKSPTWQTPAWSAPPPETLANASGHRSWDMRPIPAEHARFQRSAPPGNMPGIGNPPVLGPIADVAARQAWYRPTMTIVPDVPLSGFMRAALLADSVSPIANSSATAIDYINTDFTLYLHREPVAEWLGLELMGHSSDAGIAHGECWLHDIAGPLGSINTTAIVQRQRA